MSSYKITVIDVAKSGMREATVRKLVKLIETQLGGAANVTYREEERPDTRQGRFDAALGLVGDAKSEMEELMQELQDWRDNLPENLQSGTKADELDTAIGQLEDLIHELDGLESNSSVDFPSMM